MRRAAAALGRTLITAGILILLFVAYQLWGTGIYTSQQQSRLRHQFETALHKATPASTAPTTPATPTTPTIVPSTKRATEGNPVGDIQIPKIGVHDIVVEGVGVDDLRKGPGHYPATPLPGQRGNSAIAGHRTTYGAPFGNIDQLFTGDEIRVQTLQGSFLYRVYQHLVVDPSDLKVLEADPSRPATLTLTTCNPKYSAAQRLVVQAALASPTPLPPTPGLPKLADTGLSGDTGSQLPTLITGIIVALVGALWWLGFHRHPRWTNWLIGVIPFAVALFFFFTYLERVLPANY